LHDIYFFENNLLANKYAIKVFEIIQGLNIKYFMQTFPVTCAKTTIRYDASGVLENMVHVYNFIAQAN
jgi:hypothetical protein